MSQQENRKRQFHAEEAAQITERGELATIDQWLTENADLATRLYTLLDKMKNNDCVVSEEECQEVGELVARIPRPVLYPDEMACKEGVQLYLEENTDGKKTGSWGYY